MQKENRQPQKLIKKYANRRLYDTDKSRYITLADLTLMAREHIRFIVEDARTGENITRQILVQIISDHEVNQETSMMSVDALREVVGLYVSSPINQMFIDYLGNALANFMRQQSGLQQHMDGLFAEFAPASSTTEQLSDQQAKMWNSLTAIFNPLHDDTEPGRTDELEPTQPVEKAPSANSDLADDTHPAAQSELAELKEQIAAIQDKLNQLGSD